MKKVVFFGSSLISGAGASSPARRFSTKVASTLGWEEVNLGLPGSTVIGRDEDGQLIHETSGIVRVPDVLDAHPDFVIVLFGGDDFAASSPIGLDAPFQQGTFFWDYDTILRGLLYDLRPEQVVISSIPYRQDALTPNALGLTLPDYNAAIDALAGRYLLRLLDPYREAMIAADNFATLSVDSADLNDAGHERLAAYFIESLLVVREMGR